eukprot:CAMPEP_0175042166 /NCGR_PEP_ID=MMETSP0052_2-20121109/2385_1 /TAXON_ID=51329 ORGANISM="Polytomella parva, Strain SAG 63-3" /NCGR_SAMPLE_ID=MMETSP0052_2 /ASSEMBLY_ACC=CAM_ASM_000194 /LENGTH=149 /DNA_ID=CAMNT_0016304893 /DNA_START=26 /DNA_END=472 /DNA_ORIENTATION=+
MANYALGQPQLDTTIGRKAAQREKKAQYAAELQAQMRFDAESRQREQNDRYSRVTNVSQSASNASAPSHATNNNNNISNNLNTKSSPVIAGETSYSTSDGPRSDNASGGGSLGAFEGKMGSVAPPPPQQPYGGMMGVGGFGPGMPGMYG